MNTTQQVITPPYQSATQDGVRWARQFGLAALASILSVLIAGMVLGPGAWQLQYPYSYSGDGLSHGLLIKTVVDSGWYLNLSGVGAPYSSSFLSYPIDEGFHVVLIRILGWMTSSYAATFNLFYLLGFALTAGASYFVMRSFRVNEALAVSGAIVYSIIPFHFLRLEHLFLASFVAIPLAAGLAYHAWLAANEPHPIVQQRGRKLALYFSAVVVGSAGVYYAAFACMLLSVSAGSAWMARRTIRAVRPACGWIAVILATVLLNLAPHMMHSLKSGNSSAAVTTRSAAESELYSLRPMLLLLPTPTHRSKLLADIGDRYTKTMLLVNENRTAALGTLGSIGFLAAFLIAWRRLMSNSAEKNDFRSAKLWLATQSLATLMIGTFGGFGALFAFFVTPALRGYNRISVVISFLAITIFFLLLQQLIERRVSARRSAIAMVIAAMATCAFAVWDQTSNASKLAIDQTAAVWQSDKKFVQSIEARNKADSSFLVWPFLGFPERPPLHEEGYNGMLRLPLQAASSRWSYGAMAGSTADQWLTALTQLPLPVVVPIAAKSGFAGIVVVRRALKDGGREVDSVLTAMLGSPSVSDDGSFASYRLTATGTTPLAVAEFSTILVGTMSPEDYQNRLHQGISFAADEKNKNMTVRDMKGFSGSEAWGRWTDAAIANRAVIAFNQDLPTSGQLVMRLRCYAMNCNNPLRVLIGATEHRIDLKGVGEQDITVPLTAGASRSIEFVPYQPASPKEISGTADDRKIGVGIIDIRWVTTPAVITASPPIKRARESTVRQ